MAKNCLMCGKPSGMYALCIECIKLKNDGKIEKCPECGKWHNIGKNCECKISAKSPFTEKVAKEVNKATQVTDKKIH